MPEGVIAGGWGSVVAAYTLTAAGLFFYAWNLERRLRRQRRRESGDGR